MELNNIRLSCHSDRFFDDAWKIYQEAFPEQERRDLEYQNEILRHKEYNCEVIVSQGQTIGILFWWELPKCVYIEHFATNPEFRGKGIGKKILQEFIERTQKSVILEVEPPLGEIEKRRIGFYQRLGFHLSPTPYAHPPYSCHSDQMVTLAIMSYPHPIDRQGVEEFKIAAFPLVHPRRDNFVAILDTVLSK